MLKADSLRQAYYSWFLSNLWPGTSDCHHLDIVIYLINIDPLEGFGTPNPLLGSHRLSR